MFISGAALANAYGGALAYGTPQAKAGIGAWWFLLIVGGVQICLITVLE